MCVEVYKYMGRSLCVCKLIIHFWIRCWLLSLDYSHLQIGHSYHHNCTHCCSAHNHLHSHSRMLRQCWHKSVHSCCCLKGIHWYLNEGMDTYIDDVHTQCRYMSLLWSLCDYYKLINTLTMSLWMLIENTVPFPTGVN